MSKKLPGQLPEQAESQDPRSDLTGQSPVGRPSKPVRSGPLRIALVGVLGLGLGVLYIVNSTARGLIILILFGVAVFNVIRFYWWRPRIRRARPHSFVSNPDDLNADHPGPDASRQGLDLSEPD